MPDDDVIHLTVPADPTMRSVVVAAVAAVVRSGGMGDTAKVREEAGAAFDQVLERGNGDIITLAARAERPEYWYEMRRDGWTETRKTRTGG